MSDWVAKVVFPNSPGSVEYILLDNGLWTCSDKDGQLYADGLNINPKTSMRYYSFADGHYGWKQAKAAAELLGGQAVFPEEEPGPRDIVFEE